MAPRTNQCFGHLPSAVGVASFLPQLTAMYACQKRLRRRGPRPWAPVLDIRAVPTGQEPLRELLHSDQTAGSRSTRQQVRLIHSNDRQHLLPAWVAFALIESNDGRYVHWLRWRLIPYASLLCPQRPTRCSLKLEFRTRYPGAYYVFTVDAQLSCSLTSST